MSVAAGPGVSGPTPRMRIIGVLGLAQILAYGSSYYLPAVLAAPTARDTGWPLPWVVAGLSLGLLVAGLASPRVGRAIDAMGGRPVLAISSILFAAGLLCVGLSPGLPAYLAGWAVIGLGMGAGLYDAAFGTLGKYYGQKARGAIATLTLFGGFASTVCWPLSAYLVETLGWRGTCLAYAGLHLALALPAYLTFLPKLPAAHRRAAEAGGVAPDRVPGRRGGAAFWILAIVVTAASFVTAIMSVHLLTLLQMRGLELAAAVALGAIVGPSQVGARAIEIAIGRYYHPTWTLFASVALIAAGITLLWANFWILAMALAVYGAGLGIESIARGTVPFALFGADEYATLMGRLALPSLAAQAAAPFLGALVIQRSGPATALLILATVSMLNVAVAASLLARRWRVQRSAPT